MKRLAYKKKMSSSLVIDVGSLKVANKTKPKSKKESNLALLQK